MKAFLKEPAGRATIAFVVVILAIIVAMWPRHSGGDDQASTPSSGATSGVLDQPVSEGEIAQARQETALKPCPADDVAPAPGAVLSGVHAPCLADGATIDLGRATAGKPLVINMWAVWCAPCRKELPYFDQLSARAGDRLNVLAVHAKEGGDNPYVALKFLQEVGVHLPVVTDPQGAVAKAVTAPRVFPSTIMIGADGKVAAVLPRLFDTYDDLAGAVREHLGVEV